MPFFLFLTWLVGLDGNSSAMLYIRGKSIHPCLPLNLMRKAFRFSPLSNSGFFINIQSCWEILFIPSFLFFYFKIYIYIMKLLGWNDFSASVDMAMPVFHSFILHWLFFILWTTRSFIYKFYSVIVYIVLLICCWISFARQWHPTPVLLPRKSHGRRSLVGCSPWGP